MNDPHDYLKAERRYAIMRQLERQNILAAAALLIGFGLFLLILILTSSGCPVRVDPPTEDVCGSRPNCGQCASEAVCVWCPGELEPGGAPGTTGRCVGRSSTTCEASSVVSVPEICGGGTL